MILYGKTVSQGEKGLFKDSVQVSDDGTNGSHEPIESASTQAALKQKQSMEGLK
jgi:hypothetical protein